MICRKCKQDREDLEFREFVLNGRSYKRKTCFQCKLQSQKTRKSALRQFINSYKISCSRCGFSDYRALQFHHLSSKTMNIADAVRKGWSIKRLRDEIEKCEIICSNCHSIEHYREVP